MRSGRWARVAIAHSRARADRQRRLRVSHHAPWSLATRCATPLPPSSSWPWRWPWSPSSPTRSGSTSGLASWAGRSVPRRVSDHRGQRSRLRHRPDRGRQRRGAAGHAAGARPLHRPRLRAHRDDRPRRCGLLRRLPSSGLRVLVPRAGVGDAGSAGPRRGARGTGAGRRRARRHRVERDRREARRPKGIASAARA